MLTVNHITKTFGQETVLNGVSFTVNRGDRLGLVGSNGSGKTTLLRIITGQEIPDSGSVRFNPSELRLGYLPQGLVFEDGDTIGDFLNLDHDGQPLLVHELERLALELSRTPNDIELQRKYDLTLNGLASASTSAQRVPEVLDGLGLDEFAFDVCVSFLSGGQKTRLSLAKVLLYDPQLLLLDEPTNHLDIEMLEWLEGWLSLFSGGVLVVSHDRAFLDGMATAIIEIDSTNHNAQQFAGNYSAYLEQKIALRERQWATYKDQREEINRLQASVTAVERKARFRKGGKGDSGDKFAKGFHANRTRNTVRRARQLEARIERLQTSDRVEKPRQSWQMKLEFTGASTSGQEVLNMTELSVGYGEKVLISEINLTLWFGARAALIGPNGSGKTTLLRTISGQIPALSGESRIGAGVKIGYMTQDQGELDPDLNAFETLRGAAPLTETEARNFLHRFLFSGDDVFVSIGSLSYGERARISLACLVAKGTNFLLLDEPINHLDIPSRARFEQALDEFDGTVLAVVHDRYFIAGFASEVWEARDGSIQQKWLDWFD